MSGKSKDNMLSKIRKINFYLKYDEDLETYTTTGQLSVEEIFKNKTEITSMRADGVYKLTEYIGSFYPGSQLLIERIEADIFDYSTKNYEFNIKKILFLFKNYQNKLKEIGFYDSFIVAFVNGNKTEIKKAIEMIKKD